MTADGQTALGPLSAVDVSIANTQKALGPLAVAGRPLSERSEDMSPSDRERASPFHPPGNCSRHEGASE